MKKLAVCFTPFGAEVITKLNKNSAAAGIGEAEAYYLGSDTAPAGFDKVEKTLSEWTESVFLPGNALIFVGAAGIAVRALSGLPKNKLEDCPVLVIDDGGRFVIPVLSGHAGGANKMAATIAKLLDAVPVITTSTDVHDAFSADTFAVENHLTITDKAALKKVSVKALQGKAVTLSVKDYPPKEKTDIIVADRTDAEYDLLLKQGSCFVGLGMKKGTDADALDSFFRAALKDLGITPEDVYAFCTIDLKEDEEALRALRDRYRIPVITFDAPLLQKAKGDFASSGFVKKTVGVDNVCERAAVLGAGNTAELILKKQTGEGMTIAVARRRHG